MASLQDQTVKFIFSIIKAKKPTYILQNKRLSKNNKVDLQNKRLFKNNRVVQTVVSNSSFPKEGPPCFKMLTREG